MSMKISGQVPENAFVVSNAPQAIEGKRAGRGERRPAAQPARRAGLSGMWVQGETEAGSSCEILGRKETRGGRFAASRRERHGDLGRFLCGFGCGLGLLLRPGLGRKLLLDLGSDGIGIDLVHRGSIAEHICAVVP